MRRRPIIGDYRNMQPDGLIDPLVGGKAHSKDPRNFVSGNVPGQQWDIAQQSVNRDQLVNNPPPRIGNTRRGGQQARPTAVSRGMPTRITYIPFILSGNTTVPNTPYLLVPRNPQRLALQLTATSYTFPQNDGDCLHFSWGKPALTGITGVPFGNLLGPGQMLNLTGDVVPIDDLWVWNLSVTGIWYCAFEGVEAQEANS